MYAQIIKPGQRKYEEERAIKKKCQIKRECSTLSMDITFLSQSIIGHVPLFNRYINHCKILFTYTYLHATNPLTNS